MPLFVRGRRNEVKQKKGVKRGLKNKQPPLAKKSKFDSGLDEEITSEEDDEEFIRGKNNIEEEKESEDEETAQEKKSEIGSSVHSGIT